MKVFVTGASGFIGQAVVPELLNNGHQVLGLARSDKSAEFISQIGAEVHRGDIEDLESLKAGVRAADGIIHLGFALDAEDFSKFPQACANDRAAIVAMASAIAGTEKPLVIATATMTLRADSQMTEEADHVDDSPLSIRVQSEPLLTNLVKEKGIRGSIVRLSPVVHGPNDKVFVPLMIKAARRNGTVYYVGDGSNVWPSVHRADAAALFRLALEKGRAGAKYHAVAELVRFKDMQEVISTKLQLPLQSISSEEAMDKIGFLGAVLAINNPVLSESTKKELGWQPTQQGLLSDMDANYF